MQTCRSDGPLELPKRQQQQIVSKVTPSKKLRINIPESAPFKLVTSLETQRSEDSHLLSSPCTFRENYSVDLNNLYRTKDHDQEL